MGRLIRQPCEVCGEKKVEAHHDDYDKPLDVRWLCKAHHTDVHRKPKPPVQMLRAAITRDEVWQLRAIALQADMTTQQLLAQIIRERLSA
jgi:hypothetical protein